jgi:DNA polymerase-1
MAKMILQVHDELIFEVPEGGVDRVRKIVVEEMERVVSLTVPLKVDVGVGRNWREAHP